MVFSWLLLDWCFIVFFRIGVFLLSSFGWVFCCCLLSDWCFFVVFRIGVLLSSFGLVFYCLLSDWCFFVVFFRIGSEIKNAWDHVVEKTCCAAADDALRLYTSNVEEMVGYKGLGVKGSVWGVRGFKGWG